MGKPTNLFSFSSLLMASIFGYSASVQLNDPDWYFWFPLYSLACVVNLMNHRNSRETTIRPMGKTALVLGGFLFVKVVLEDFVKDIAGILSLDLSERVVREKVGSCLVMISMALHLEASSDAKNRKGTRFLDYGMAALVALNYGIPFVFFVIQRGETKI